MRKLLLVTFMLLGGTLYAQQYIWSTDTVLDGDPNYAMDRYHDMLRFHDPFMYLAFPYIQPLNARKVPLADGEGKNGYFAEGQFAYRFSIYKGEYYSYPLLQRMRLTLDVNLLLRLSADKSFPLLPSNNKVGLGWDFLWSRREKLAEKRGTMVWTTLQLHHYSNGQAGSFFSTNAVQRNNYISGDFSTNYCRGMLNITNYSQQNNIFTFSAGYQRELDLGGPLIRSIELQKYYGFDRVLAGLQWAQKPRLVVGNYENHATEKTDKVKLVRRRQWSVRTELEYIADDVSKFAGTNKQRLGWHSYVTFIPSITNEVGFLVHTYVGRDYLNIRFDDVVLIGELGVYVKFNTR